MLAKKKRSTARANGQPARRLESGEEVGRLGERLLVQRVVVPAAFATTSDDPGVDQSLEVPRQPRLLKLEVVHQVAHAPLAIEELRNDVHPDRIRERVKQL